MVTIDNISFLLVHLFNNELIPIYYTDFYDEISQKLKEFKKERQIELFRLDEEDKSFEFILKSENHYITHGEEIFIISDKEKIKEIINNYFSLSENNVCKK